MTMIYRKLKNIANAILALWDMELSRKSTLPIYANEKYRYEIRFWRKTLRDYSAWYEGKLPILYGETSPKDSDKVTAFSTEFNAIVTWELTHQRKKYLQDLKLDASVFAGMKILDVGSGPHPSALAFTDCKVYSLDPLLPLYIEAGFPIHIYDDRQKFVFGFAEKIPFTDNYFDAVISVNAIDHVDDFTLAANEIKRVLKQDGLLRLHVHYHLKTKAEPIELNDDIVQKAFGGVKDFVKISESKNKRGSSVKDDNERYTVWSNFNPDAKHR